MLKWPSNFLRKHVAKTGEELEAGEPVAEAAKPERQARKVPDTIHRAAGNGNIEAVKKHLADGADVNAKSSGGRTPLLGAAHRGHKEIVELLIAKGADVNVKDKYGNTPLDRAIQQKHTETAALLRKHGGKTGEELKAAGK